MENKPRRPFVTNNTGKNDWNTPPYIIEAARSVMGSIDLDPASNIWANEWIKSYKYCIKNLGNYAKPKRLSK